MTDDRAEQIKATVREAAKEPAQLPSVGRMVHYVAYGTPGGEFPAGVCRAAIITEVNVLHPGSSGVNQLNPQGKMTSVGVLVMNPTGLFFNRGIPYNEGKAPGSWHWPERT